MKEKLQKWLKKAEKYKYAGLILLLGVAILCVPFGEKETPLPEAEPPPAEELAEQLEEILSHVEGAGSTRVLLSVKTGMTYTYQENTQLQKDAEREETRRETVFASKSGADDPVLCSTTYPVYKGAVVVCEGADKASVKYEIIRAVSDVTGLGSDKIAVIKMKQY